MVSKIPIVNTVNHEPQGGVAHAHVILGFTLLGLWLFRGSIIDILHVNIFVGSLGLALLGLLGGRGSLLLSKQLVLELLKHVFVVFERIAFGRE